MSTKAMALVWAYYQSRRFGAQKIVALALADEADDQGGGISASVKHLADKADLSERVVRRQQRLLEAAGLLSCSTRSAGGVGKFSEYSLNLAALLGGGNPDDLTGLTRTKRPGSTPQNPDEMTGFERAPYSSSCTTKVLSTSDKDVLDVENVRVSEAAELRRLAEWMFGLLLRLNPKLKAPSWSAWCRDLRFMVTRDKHTTREVAELFKFANGHAFWQANIESPGKLRKQWNRLLLERDKAGGGQAQAAVDVDTSCSGVLDSGARCGAKNATSDSTDGRGPFFCWSCRERADRARAARGGKGEARVSAG